MRFSLLKKFLGVLSSITRFPGEFVKVVDASLEFRVAGKIVKHLETQSFFPGFEGFKEFRGAADMSKVTLKCLQGRAVRLDFTGLGLFGCA
jgi:hypothetical protein